MDFTLKILFTIIFAIFSLYIYSPILPLLAFEPTYLLVIIFLAVDLDEQAITFYAPSQHHLPSVLCDQWDFS